MLLEKVTELEIYPRILSTPA